MNQSDNKITIYIVRHGKTLFNTAKKVQGWSDSPLLQEGIEGAAALGEKLKADGIKIDAVYSADLLRHRLTAKYIMERLGIPFHDLQEKENLREVCFGSLEGADVRCVIPDEEELKKLYTREGITSFLEMLSRRDDTGMAETLNKALARIRQALDEITKDAQKNSYRSVLAITSGMILSILAGSLGAEIDGAPPNLSITEIVYHNGIYTIEKNNCEDCSNKGNYQ